MTVLEKMLSGFIEMSEYIVFLRNDIELQKELNSIVPQAAINNADHTLWKRISYNFISKYSFNLYNCIISFNRLDDSIGDNLNIFSLLERIYSYTMPDFVFTTRYHDAHDTYLEVVKDCYDGPEVRTVVNAIIKKNLSIENKSTRNKESREEIHKTFHIVDKNKPRWVQGAEWPMGINAPMKFIEQKRYRGYQEYLFIDLDTQEKRIVVQYY